MDRLSYLLYVCMDRYLDDLRVFCVVVGEMILPLMTSHPLSHTTTLPKSPRRILDPLKLSRFKVLNKNYLQVQTYWWRAEMKCDGKKATEHQEASGRGQAAALFLLNQESQTLSMSQWSSLCCDCHKGNSFRLLFFNSLLALCSLPLHLPLNIKKQASGCFQMTTHHVKDQIVSFYIVTKRSNFKQNN